MNTILTKAQSELILSYLPVVKNTRPRKYSPLALIQGIVYLLKTGCQWRNIPDVYPPWSSCYKYFQDLVYTRSLECILYSVNKKSLRPTRTKHILVTDSQSVRSTEMCRAHLRGYDGNKKVKGHKRLVLVDTKGRLWWNRLDTANTGERSLLVATLQRSHRLVTNQGFSHVIADKGFCGDTTETTLRRECNIQLCAMKRVKVDSGTLLGNTYKAWSQHFNKSISKIRYVVEQFFSWIQRQRRLMVNYERTTRMHEGFITLAGILLQVKRLAKPNPNLHYV